MSVTLSSLLITFYGSAGASPSRTDLNNEIVAFMIE
jgi:hypothetical protein